MIIKEDHRPLSIKPESFNECPSCLAVAYLHRKDYAVCFHCKFIFVRWFPASIVTQIEWHKEEE